MYDARIHLQQLGLASLGLYFGPPDGINGPATRAALEKFKQTIARESGSFEDLVESWELRYFSAAELLFKGASHSSRTPNTDPPRELWGNIKDAALAADEARHRLGSPLVVLSAYRSPSYNKVVKGSGDSLHMQFRALDLKPPTGKVNQLHTILKQLRKEGYPGARGIGLYSTFCHTDNGSSRDF